MYKYGLLLYAVYKFLYGFSSFFFLFPVLGIDIFCIFFLIITTIITNIWLVVGFLCVGVCD
jgi:hypothetical protein